jgi:type IV pilus assembly protein PilM
VDWKKEIKLTDLVGRKPDGSPSADADTELPMHARPEEHSMEQASTETVVATVEEPVAEAVVDAPVEPVAGTAVETVVETAVEPVVDPVAQIGLETDLADGPVEAVAEQPAQEKKSIWKRELGSSRKKKDDGEEKPQRRQLSRFAATPGKEPVAVKPVEEKKPGRMGRLSRSSAQPKEAKPPKQPKQAKVKEPKQAKPPKERKPSRFARPGRSPQAGDVTEATPKTKTKSPLSRELSFSLKRKPKAVAAGGATTAAAKKSRGKKAEVVGLKVGASHLAAAQVTQNGTLELIQYAREPLERGLVVGGELRDPEKLGEHLKEFFRKHKLPPKAVRLGIGTNRIGVRRLEITGLADASHLENAIRFRAQEVLPIPLEEAVLDYQVVGEETDDKGQTTYRVLLVVAYRDLIQRYVKACRAAGLKLVGIDLEAFALLRSLGPTKETAKDDAAVVVVSIGHDRSTFVVADGEVCEFARVLDWGGGALDVALARVLDKTPSQVEHIKHSLTLNATQERLEGYTQEQAVAVYEAVRKELQTFVRELVSSLHFYQNQPGSLGIGEITITGGTAQLPGLAAELQRLIGVTVRVGDPFGRVDTSKRGAHEGELGSAAVAIGLGIEG